MSQVVERVSSAQVIDLIVAEIQLLEAIEKR